MTIRTRAKELARKLHVRGVALLALWGGLAAGTAVVAGAAAPTSQPQASAVARTAASSSPSARATTLQATTTKTPAASAKAAAPQPPAAATAAPLISRADIVAFLGSVINWRKAIDAQIQQLTEPEDTLFVAEDRRLAIETLHQAFAFARAAMPLAGSPTEQPVEALPAAATGGAVTSSLRGSLREMEQHREQLRKLAEELRAALGTTRGPAANSRQRDRAAVASETAARQGQLDLVQARLESLDASIDFAKGADSAALAPAGLEAQIDELERSTTGESGAESAATASRSPRLWGGEPAPSVGTASAALPGSLDRLLVLRQKEQVLASALESTARVAAAVDAMRHRFSQSLTQLDQERTARTAQIGGADLATSRRATAEFKELAARGKLIILALEPLARQTVLLRLYASNLERWRASVNERWNEELRHQILHALSVALVFGVVFAAAVAWRRLTFRYVEDPHRRQQLLQLRRLALIVTLALVLVFGFTSELSSLATVMGFAAAGVALALQNVILSLAGYFYLSGRFGIRVGDRVQIAGITGDVLESGFFKLTLMEIGDDEHGRQPTGRAVIFPNSVVFQPNSNFFRQLPGTGFVWNELRLALAPDCDYGQAEQLVTAVIQDVLQQDRAMLESEHRALASNLNLRIPILQPQTRLQLGAAGLTMVVRYPARLTAAMQTADDVTRRLVDAIRQAPGVKLLAGIAPLPTASDAGAPPHDP